MFDYMYMGGATVPTRVREMGGAPTGATRKDPNPRNQI